jgi:hypothetical protein
MAKAQTATGDAMFTRADYDHLRLHRRRLTELLGKIDKAKACGIACDFIEQQRKETDAQLEAIEQHFMTPPPGK